MDNAAQQLIEALGTGTDPRKVLADLKISPARAVELIDSRRGRRLMKHHRRLAQVASRLLAQRFGADVVVKHENHTPIGAFKVRGGLVYVDRVKRALPNLRGLISATRGNHGQSLAFAGHRHGLPVTIYVPHGNSVEKNRAMRAFGAKLVEHGDDFQAAREEAYREADRAGLHIVPAFHRDLVLGVATYALELLRHARDLDVLYVPIGQGSGICGCVPVVAAHGVE